MGLTAEAVAKGIKINREDRDMFALQNHQKRQWQQLKMVIYFKPDTAYKC